MECVGVVGAVVIYERCLEADCQYLSRDWVDD